MAALDSLLAKVFEKLASGVLTERTLARVLMTAPAGTAVKGMLDRFHELEANTPDAGQMLLQSIQYGSYRELTANAYAMALCGIMDADLSIALHGAEVLEEVREGTAGDMPTGEAYELDILTPELWEKWYGEIASERRWRRWPSPPWRELCPRPTTSPSRWRWPSTSLLTV